MFPASASTLLAHAAMAPPSGGVLFPLLLAGSALAAVTAGLLSPRATVMLAWCGGSGREGPTSWAARALPLVSGLSVAAGTIHFAVVPDHLAEAAPIGIAFALLAAFQLILASKVLRGPSPGLWTLGAAVNIAVVGVYLVSRTTGMPFGGHMGGPEAVGAIDAFATGAELLTAGACLWSLRIWPSDVFRSATIRLWTEGGGGERDVGGVSLRSGPARRG